MTATEDYYSEVRKMSLEEACAAMDELTSLETQRRLIGKPTLHWAMIGLVLSRIQELRVENMLRKMGFKPVHPPRALDTEGILVQPMSEPRGLIFPPRIVH